MSPYKIKVSCKNVKRKNTQQENSGQSFWNDCFLEYLAAKH